MAEVPDVVAMCLRSLEHHIAFISFRNEQAASYAASVVGFVRPRQPAVCLSVAGPGLVHALAGMANAHANCWPMLLLAAGAPAERRGQGAFQELPQLELARPLAAWAVRADSAASLPALLAEAVQRTLAPRPGPVYVELSADLLMQRVALPHPLPLPPAIARDPAGATPLAQAVQLIRAAARPLLLLGKGAAYAQAEHAARRLVEQTQLPFVPSPMAKGLLPDSHEHCVGAARSLALARADVVLVVGARLNWLWGFGQPPVFASDAHFVLVDLQPEPHARALALQGDAQVVLDQLSAALGDWRLAVDQPWWSELRAKRAVNHAQLARQCAEAVAAGPPLSYHAVLSTIAAALPSNALIVNEGANTMDLYVCTSFLLFLSPSSSLCSGRLLLPSSLPRSRLDAGTLGAMGLGAGYAIAAACVQPSQRVVCVQGDSAFGFGAMEVETAWRYRFPIVFVVLNNNGIYAGEEVLAGCSGTSIAPTSLSVGVRYEKLLEACGPAAASLAWYVETVPQLQQALVSALAVTQAPSFIHVRIRTDGPVPKIVAQKH